MRPLQLAPPGRIPASRLFPVFAIYDVKMQRAAPAAFSCHGLDRIQASALGNIPVRKVLPFGGPSFSTANPVAFHCGLQRLRKKWRPVIPTGGVCPRNLVFCSAWRKSGSLASLDCMTGRHRGVKTPDRTILFVGTEVPASCKTIVPGQGHPNYDGARLLVESQFES